MLPAAFAGSGAGYGGRDNDGLHLCWRCCWCLRSAVHQVNIRQLPREATTDEALRAASDGAIRGAPCRVGHVSVKPLRSRPVPVQYEAPNIATAAGDRNVAVLDGPPRDPHRGARSRAEFFSVIPKTGEINRVAGA